MVTDASDNYGPPIINWVNDVSDGNSCPETITRTYSVTDSCGNSINVTQNIIIFDTIPPTGTNPSNITIPGSAPAPDITVVTDAQDNCGIPIIAHVSDISDGLFCPETIIRTYSITDICGNSITVEQIIIVADPEIPTASNPTPISVECIDDVPSPDIGVVTDASDNYGPPIINWVSDVSDGNSCPETVTRTYSVTDSCGNSINVTQTITINDITPPSASNLTPIQIECTDDIPIPNIEDVTDEADNCGTPSVAFISDVSDGLSCPETIIRTYSVTDSCGNSINVTQTITIIDITPPNATPPNDISLPTGPIPDPDITSVQNVTDNCGIPIVTWVNDVSEGNCPTIVTRTYEITDECGNSTLVSHAITIDQLENDIVANISATPQEISPLNSTVSFLNSSINANNYQWDFGDGSPISNVEEPSHYFDPTSGYIVTMIASTGTCVDTATVVITLNELTIFYVPNTFTPDGDQFNHVFYPVFTSGFDPYDFEMLIFDRWGEIIFETHDVNIGWDGTYSQRNKKVQDGVYTWKITYKNRQTDLRNVVMGHVTLIR